MTDFNAADRDVTRAIRSWLHEDRHEEVSRIAGAVLDQVGTVPQRRATWWPARRTPEMNRFVTIGLGAAAVVLALVIGAQLIGGPGGIAGPGDPTISPEASVADPTPEPTPSPTPWTGIAQGPFVVAGADSPVQVTLDVAVPGWSHDPGLDYVYKNDDGLDPPQSVGVALIAWGWPVGTEFLVYGDPCQWRATVPATPATTPAEIAAGFAAQAQTDATEPVDVSVGGYAGKAVTLTVPMSYEVPGATATREEKFGACDEDAFVYYGIVGDDGEIGRNAQGPGQIDELWILDVEGSIVILDAAYGPATPADLVAELRALAESATFEAP